MPPTPPNVLCSIPALNFSAYQTQSLPIRKPKLNLRRKYKAPCWSEAHVTKEIPPARHFHDRFAARYTEMYFMEVLTSEINVLVIGQAERVKEVSKSYWRC